MTKLPDDLQYSILPGHFHPGFVHTALYNRAFVFWRQFWNGVYRDNGSDDTVYEMDFIRSELITVLSSGDEIVGLHLYSILNLEMSSTPYHPYLNATGDRVFTDLLLARGCRSAMPLEYLTVNAAWRKSRTGLSLTPVLIGLGCRIQAELGIDAIIGRARSDLKINERMADAGSITLKSNVMMHNTPTDFCAIFLADQRPHPDLVVRKLIDRLWATRVDATGLTINKQSSNNAIGFKRAA